MTSSSATTPAMVTPIEGLCSKRLPITFGSYLPLHSRREGRNSGSSSGISF
ncbi:hypothetical protein RDI58_008440 [Solanum bulbocastanum]|uniref:Uncharacterized protein n=1 Tax=Solanum bulbocastanum TaxID=147425 RepID=A0AAN8U3F5_SOLBU